MGVENIAQCAAAGAEPVAELALLDGHVGPVIALMDGKVFEGGPAGTFRGGACVDGGIGEDFAEVARKSGGGHGVVEKGDYGRRYFWSRLLGLSGRVYSTRPSAIRSRMTLFS
jgi:hypothetical protein